MPAAGNDWIGAVVPRLHRAGLRIAIPQPWQVSSWDGAAALVVSPAPGPRVPRGTVATLRMSGMPGVKADTAGRSTVPDVVGDTLRRAQASIGTAGLQWRANASALRPTATADLLAVYCVVSQQPHPGTVIRVPDPVHPDVVALRARPC